MKVCTIIWTEEDVLVSVKEMNRTRDKSLKKIVLSPKDIELILESMEETHDATIGITWSTIEFWIDIILDKRSMN